MATTIELQQLFTEQLTEWESLRDRYTELKSVRVKRLSLHGSEVQVQFNPARIISSAARLDSHSLQARPCFLCEKNRPREQRGIADESFTWLVNPFPIFPVHFTLPTNEHSPQRIKGRFGDMLRMAKDADRYILFYNGPKCGASAPDHAHFQAGNKGFLPLEKAVEKARRISLLNGLSLVKEYICPFFLIETDAIEKSVSLFERLYSALDRPEKSEEPMLNLLTWFDNGKWVTCIFPRTQHRPSCYFAEGERHILLSPASVDMGGIFITPREEDFEKITADDLTQIIAEVTPGKDELNAIINRLDEKGEEPVVTVGIMSGETIRFILHGNYQTGDSRVDGEQEVSIVTGQIRWNGHSYNQLEFIPQDPTGAFTLKGVTIGVKFHWERQEDQTFRGALRLIVEEGRITAINLLGIEEYLLSVISSEMSATASLELLKSHAVISRSWLLAQIQKNKALAGERPVSTLHRDGELIRWYDREDHTHFDVCADDHCQRYQGITRTSTPLVAQAIEATRGEILTHEGRICDTRFSKCCGGVVEEFASCWEPMNHPYLRPLRDCAEGEPLPNLREEDNARQWIYSSPEAFCHTTDKKILSQVLNNYDQETTDFYRWRVSYTQTELARIIREKSGIDFGDILDLVPVERGASGRLIRLRIVGSKETLVIGKELEIRRILSPTHLYSSAFVIECEAIEEGIPQRFTLYGAGWGHGVGLCQIGAAVMGERGYTYDQILLHYFVDAQLEKLY